MKFTTDLTINFKETHLLSSNIFGVNYNTKHLIVSEDDIERLSDKPWLHVICGGAYLRMRSSKTNIIYVWHLVDLYHYNLPHMRGIERIGRSELKFNLFDVESPGYDNLRETYKKWILYVYVDMSQEYWNFLGKLKIWILRLKQPQNPFSIFSISPPIGPPTS